VAWAVAMANGRAGAGVTRRPRDDVARERKRGRESRRRAAAEA
jgi:hypothetical protein